MQPGRKHQHAVAQRRAGQGVGHRRLDLLPALRAPVAMDRMLGHFRLNVRNVFGITGAGFLRTASIDHHNPGNDRPDARPASRSARVGVAASRMALLGPRLFSSFALGRFLVDRHHPRRGRGRDRRRTSLGKLFGQLQECKDYGFLSLAKELARLCLGKRRLLQCLK